MTEELRALYDMIIAAERIVFFGGAGVSTESGIPDFRSQDGLYQENYSYPPERIVSHSFYLENPEEFYRFYRSRMLYPDAKPNQAHLALAALERMGKLRAVITQNIDGLHQKAGSQVVYELHGSVHRNICRRCHKLFPLSVILAGEAVPRCPDCGGELKPDVVLYEEGLDQRTIQNALTAIRGADLLIIGGTSLNVYPAAGLIDAFDREHGRIVLINKGETARETGADLVIRKPIAEVLGQVTAEITA